MDWPIHDHSSISSCTVELENKEVVRFKVNGQRIKIYLGRAKNANEVVEAYLFDEV